jgi:Protein of unknown function (DUF2924)
LNEGCLGSSASEKAGSFSNVVDEEDPELRDLAGLDLVALRAEWKRITKRDAPAGFRRSLLIRALAHERQVARFGGLSASRMRQLRKLAEAARLDRFDVALGVPALKAGTVLVREWQGQPHRVTVTSDGFLWRGEAFGSLSTIARAITGTSWNGWTFFGVDKPLGRNRNGAKRKLAAGATELKPKGTLNGQPVARDSRRFGVSKAETVHEVEQVQ